MIQILSVVTPKMATISNFVTHIVSSNVNLMHNNRFEQAKAMTFYDPSSNKPSTVQWWFVKSELYNDFQIELPLTKSVAKENLPFIP